MSLCCEGWHWVVHQLAGWRGARCMWVVYNHPVRMVNGMILRDLV